MEKSVPNANPSQLSYTGIGTLVIWIDLYIKPLLILTSGSVVFSLTVWSMIEMYFSFENVI